MARGSITKRGDVYTVRYDVPSATGRRKQARRSFPTLKAAERFLASTITAIDRGDVVASTGETFAEYAPRWLSEHRAHVEHATAIDYDNTLRNHLLPYFGSMRLDKITAESIRKYVAGKLDGTAAVREQPDGKGGRITTKLSPKTINNQVTTLGLILGHTVEDRLIARNPAERRGSRRSLKVKVPHRERDYLRAAEVPAYLDACSAFWRPRALALILTGMRMGELLALRWEDVDWHGRAVIVHRALKRDGAIGSTKGEETGRRVDAASVLLDALRDLRTAASEHDLAIDDGLAFPQPGGGFDSAKRLLDQEHRPALKRAGLRLSLVNHELRHTAAAAWLSQGYGLEYVRRQMGHRSITTTIANYGHLEPTMSADAADRTAAALGIAVE